MSNIDYKQLQMQNYLTLPNMTVRLAQTVFNYRVRMANYGDNFRHGEEIIICPLCGNHSDSQFLGYSECKTISEHITLRGNYSDIFNKSLTIDFKL